jgi:ABC-type antimicrobial peptide transport system permease subunit
MAVGAPPGEVIRLILRQGMFLTLAGVILGIGGTLILRRAVATFLYGIQSHDLLTFLVTSAVLATVGLAASYMPARRASKLDPSVALRYD